MSEVAKQIEVENEENETPVAVAKPVPQPPKKEWVAYDGRKQVGRNTREKQGHQTNGDYAAQQEHFRKACEAAEIPATARQASKFRMGKGVAYAAHKRSLNK
jgi:hypothetical protein